MWCEKPKKKEAMESCHGQTTDAPVSWRWQASSPLRKLKGTQPTKTPAVQLADLEEDVSNNEGEAESEDPSGIDGVSKEFIVCLTRAIKEAQKEEKHCYHCSSPEYFIRDCPLVKSARAESHLNHKEGVTLKKGAWTPQVKVTLPKAPQDGMPKA